MLGRFPDELTLIKECEIIQDIIKPRLNTQQKQIILVSTPKWCECLDKWLYNCYNVEK